MGVLTAEEADKLDNMNPIAQAVQLGTRINSIAGTGDIGNIALLTTTDKTSVVNTINELDAGKYEKPGTGIPSTDMTAAVQAS